MFVAFRVMLDVSDRAPMGGNRRTRLVGAPPRGHVSKVTAAPTANRVSESPRRHNSSGNSFLLTYATRAARQIQTETLPGREVLWRMMMLATVRPYERRDLGRLIQLWGRTAALPVGPDRLTIDQAVDLISSPDIVTLVAEQDGDVVGVALGSVSAVVGWIHTLLVGGKTQDAEVCDQLLGHLEGQLAERGARRLAALASEADPVRGHLERRGYRSANDLLYLERDVPTTIPFPASLAELGARMIDPGLWDHFKGMEEAKEIIERRVILPLAEPDLAARHAVAPPKAIVLFGPPGTGKTTFAKGIASRLTWPFIEIQPAELGGEGPEQQARLLARTFDKILALTSAVIFVDEVEDLASVRHQ
jgi:transitional endoplasmic reticulum ATPase